MTKRLLQKLLLPVWVVGMAIGVYMLLNNDFVHLEDTNGTDYTLQTITDADIEQRAFPALGLKESKGLFSSQITYSSDKFSGVEELFSTMYYASTIRITVNHAKVTAGNFRMMLLVDDKIVHEFALNELTQEYWLEDVTGTVAMRIAGESAAFQCDFAVD